MAIVDYQQGELIEYSPSKTKNISLKDCFFDYEDVARIVIIAQMQAKVSGISPNVDFFIKEYVSTYYK